MSEMKEQVVRLDCYNRCQYVYDLEVGEDILPKPGDNEVEDFYLWTVEEVQRALAKESSSRIARLSSWTFRTAWSSYSGK
jgi:hypothetical protein